MKTEAYLYDGKREDGVFKTKLELFRGNSENIKGLKVTFWDRVFEIEFEGDEKQPSLIVRKTSDSEMSQIRKGGFRNVGKIWSEEEVQKLIELFNYFKGDVAAISKQLERTERSVLIRLKSIGLIEDEKGQSNSDYERMKDFAEERRKTPPTANKLLWERLKAKKLGLKFRRTHIFKGKSICVDFFNVDKKLAIELDASHRISKNGEIEEFELDKNTADHLGITVMKLKIGIGTNLNELISDIQKALE